ncbi:uncharacterized protein L969DRAFT_19808 [Mixia osmundae IAM 14324]|uniref:BTB domain-containing protein n=1 Tax=Mixia osmundae (strain CBS 9802 / IAM 14324 / JCM 22182 / KY 12970) TaxID=764103 RepID=G7E274_MIXOS|nr:uncharacterized protein L969DRAFT_19808 [Mixia osmundae IAM 14324]KEI36806.1 hypothetical protein L969DRAFT_19808 [Mixia osmundae IAM 14324]GAA96934.1 hypothetical protein E5Q_03608 [Mixia osmundae IAM 14324]
MVDDQSPRRPSSYRRTSPPAPSEGALGRRRVDPLQDPTGTEPGMTESPPDYRTDRRIIRQQTRQVTGNDTVVDAFAQGTGDVIFRSANAGHSRPATQFLLHLANLRTNSPVFSTLLEEPDALPRLPPLNLPCIQVEEDAETLHILFQYFYPRPAPVLCSYKFGVIKTLFSAAHKYEVFRAIDAATTELRQFATVQPFVVYAVATSISPPSEELAREASRHTLVHKLTKLKPSYFGGLSGIAVHRLWMLHNSRVELGREILMTTPLAKDPDHLHCSEMKLVERFWYEEVRRIADEMVPSLDIAARLGVREPSHLQCVRCYQSILRTADIIRRKWSKAPSTVV